MKKKAEEKSKDKSKVKTDEDTMKI